MVSFWNCLALVLALPVAGTYASTKQTVSVEKRAFIVEFNEAVKINAAHFMSLLKARNGISLTRRREFTSSLYRGFSFDIHERDDVDATLAAIKRMPQVRTVAPVRRITVPLPQARGNPSLPHELPGLRRRDFKNDQEPWHESTGVNLLRNQGYTGKGVRVAVIDSGVDYKHPALGGCFGKGCHIEFGRNYIGGNESDPFEEGSSHGTHTTGIVGALENPYGFTGVAPGVTLGHYRVLADEENIPKANASQGTGTDTLVKAYLDAVADGADIITASLGSLSGWGQDPWSVVVHRITLQGIICVVASGNDGADGPFMGSDGTSLNTVSVGSANNVETPAFLSEAFYTVGKENKKFGWTGNWVSIFSDFKNGTFPLITVNQTDACTPLPSLPNDPEQIVVVRMTDSCEFAEQLNHLLERNATRVLFVRSDNSVEAIFLKKAVSSFESFGMIPKDMGEEMLKDLLASENVTVTMTSKVFAHHFVAIDKNPPHPNAIAVSSQWGPSNELRLMPTIVAPGMQILSTIPRFRGGYAAFSGTSMACPYVAGVIALILEARGKVSAEEINSLLGATATPRPYFDGEKEQDFLSPVAKQGAGFLNAYRAATTNTILSTHSLLFNDTEHMVKSVKFTIFNKGKSPVTYQLTHEPVKTFYALPHNSTLPPPQAPGSIDMLSIYATLSFSQTNITVGAGQNETVEVKCEVPEGLAAYRIPVYSGYVKIQSESDSFSLPYLGAASVMRQAVILDTSDPTRNFFRNSNDSTVLKAGDEFVIAKPGTPNDTSIAPAFSRWLSMGTQVYALQAEAAGSASEPFILGANTFLGRGNSETLAVFRGVTAKNKTVPAGTYRFIVRALRMFGNESDTDDWELVRSPWFNIRYKNDTGNANGTDTDTPPTPPAQPTDAYPMPTGTQQEPSMYGSGSY